MLIIQNAVIHDAINPQPFEADILIEKGKIARIDQDISIDGAETYNAAGMDLYPGFIDVHSTFSHPLKFQGMHFYCGSICINLFI